jgi:hypothetical protein
VTCVDCGAADAHVSRLCDACLVARARASRTAQGLDPTITDPAVLDRVATVIAPPDTGSTAA